MRVHWTTQALEDAGNLYDYISSDDSADAGKVMRRIESTVDMIARHPEIGRAGRVGGTREAVVVGGPYIVVYSLKNERIEILSVMHASRRWPDAF